MNRLTADESDQRKALARKTVRLVTNGKRVSMRIDPVSREDQAHPWYFTHT